MPGPSANLSKMYDGEDETKSRKPLSEMKSDPFTVVCSFLAPEDLCRLQSVSKFSRTVIKNHSNLFWRQHCHRLFKSDIMCKEPSYILKFLRMRDQALDKQHKQLVSLERQHQGIDAYRRRYGEGIIGTISDVVWADDERVALAISAKRYMAMATILTTTEAVISRFKDVNQNLGLGPTSFLPYATAAHSINDTSHISMFKQEVNIILCLLL
jgi:hypothetical protein